MYSCMINMVYNIWTELFGFQSEKLSHWTSYSEHLNTVGALLTKNELCDCNPKRNILNKQKFGFHYKFLTLNSFHPSDLFIFRIRCNRNPKNNLEKNLPFLSIITEESKRMDVCSQVGKELDDEVIVSNWQ